jgi:hypothetical protein
MLDRNTPDEQLPNQLQSLNRFQRTATKSAVCEFDL